MTSEDFSTVPKQVDQKDRHVAAAALALRHAAEKDREDETDQAYDVILVTDNVKDLAKKQMAKLGVRVVRSGGFLNEVYDAEPEAATRAVLQAAKDLKKPPYTVAELLFALRAQGAKTLVAQMAKALGVKPVEKEHAEEGKGVKAQAK